MTAASAIERRVSRLDWEAAGRRLDERGWDLLPSLLTAADCRGLAGDYQRDDLFRSTVDLERHRFGRGQYRYFAYPLPAPVQALRQSLYARLAPRANAWMERLRHLHTYPPTLDGFLRRCHAAGQRRPTPLLLRYGAGDYNCLHQDLYGEISFPLQVLIVLSRSGVDYQGGEVVFVEQRPRAQSAPVVVVPGRGDALVFTNRERPAPGSRGFYATQMRHGASEIRSGRRLVLGIIFHDAA